MKGYSQLTYRSYQIGPGTRSVNLVLTVMMFLTCFMATAQNRPADHMGHVFVTNDFEDDKSNEIFIKWFADKLYYPDGFDVFRATGNSNRWEKINDRRIHPATAVRPYIAENNPDLEALLKLMNDTPYEEFQNGMQKVIIALKAMYSNEVAETIGIFFRDKTAKLNATYKYKVHGFTGRSYELIGISGLVTCGHYKKPDPPREVVVQRVKGEVHFNWKPEQERYYGVNVYRQQIHKTWDKITPQPRAIREYVDNKGELVYPDVFYKDQNVVDSLEYLYILSGVDYFGHETTFTDEFRIAGRDFTPPATPHSILIDIALMKPDLSWQYDSTESCAGFNVYRKGAGVEKEFEKVNAQIIPATARSFTDNEVSGGGYYYRVAAIDEAGNEQSSGLSFIEVRDVIAPPSPENVTLESDTGMVILNWDPVPAPDLKGYFVYRALHHDVKGSTDFVVVNKEPVTATKFIDRLPKNARNRFVYGVAAEDTLFNRSEISEPARVQLPDIAPPQAPFIKTVKINEDNSVSVEWLVNPELDLKGYHIYKADTNMLSEFRKQNTSIYPPESYRYTDRNLISGKTYYYYVVSEDENGNLSEISNIYNLRMPEVSSGVHEGTLDRVQLAFNKRKTQVELNWPKGEEFRGYVVYRGANSDHLVPISGLLKSNSFTDIDLVS
ncbi:MAG: hypothetical protein AAGG59_06375, partial [Bacteroidota bacterium]